MTDPTPRYRRLKSTGGLVFYHPCAECGSPDAPYGFGCYRRSGAGKWVDELNYRGHKTGNKIWKGNDPIVNHGSWYCSEHKHLGETLPSSSSSAQESSPASSPQGSLL